MKQRTRYLIYLFCGLIAGAGIITGIALRKADSTTTPIEISAEGRPQYKWYPPQVPATMEFCGEKVPLERWDIHEKMDRELLVNSYLHGSQLFIIKLSCRYFPIIEERLRANGLPDDLKYVCVAESALQQNALSGVGAASFWQFMKDTGPAYGLEINEEVDERFHIVKATDAACKYFKAAHDKFGSWAAAVASYNCGQAGYAKQADFQQATNYYDLIFPDETNRYVYRILAFKQILTHPQQYGLMMDESDAYKPLKGRMVVVDKTIENLTDFAKQNNSSYKMLKIYNPWLRGHKLTVRAGKRYEVAFPE
ncbi:MAG: lytic transglycosylase domain-containing protein [Bacteroidota bacterium]